ncbi:gelsolin [Gonium pectorale]|uniref:Gelsolin n=1 Tax=Gonium pectorale TaxID=33097 RepID=A0A150G5X0_GONPE|nr:gelsolin [Gonium pectorale]|eukprot:KXZ45279.1 gelsolin [Gonium pectorale]
MPVSAPVWTGVGSKAGLRVWRVKDFSLTEESKQDLGNFFSGDCYLVLDAFLANGSLRYHIHFWLGKDATQDEAGSVAIFAAQLDDALGGGPLQFRQPQGSESPEFLRLFPRLRYLAGGHASGFKDTAATRGKGPIRLYQIKSPNKTCVQVFEVPCALSSLNHGDCFLLEDVGGRLLWVWHGTSANIREKMRAVEAANAFKEGTGIKLSVLDDGDNVSTEALEFYRRLGCEVHPEPSAIRDAELDKPPPALLQPPRLFKVSADGQGFEQVSAEGAPLSASMLEPSGQFVLLAAGAVWVWTGHVCGSSALPPLQVGSRFAEQQGLPSSSVIKAVKARFEPGIFATFFADWGAAANGGSLTSFGSAGRDSFGNPIPGPGKGTDDQPYNAEEAAAAMAALTAEADRGGGAAADAKAASLDAAYARLTASRMQVWVMTGSSSLELPRQEVGQFYDGASYIVLHTYSTSKDGTDMRYAVYQWQGRRCGPLEAGAAAVMAADLHRAKYAGRSSLVRVEQNLEPEHFVRLFKGTMMVRSGPRPSNLAPGRSPPGVHLFQVKGEAVAVAHAVEMPPVASSLCGGDSFVLERATEIGAPAGSAEPVVLWTGRGSSAAEREVATAVAAALAAGNSVVTVEEGSEPESFWEALGGRADYPASAGRRPANCAPKLFHLRDCAGRGLKVELHTAFSQDSLVGDDVMLLDTGAELYVWYGRTCKPHERPRARDVAGRYLSAARREGVAALVEVEAGQEPHFFTCHFPGWDGAPVAAMPDVYTERLRSLSVGKGEASP